MIIMMMVILMLMMMMIARHGRADNLHGERCRRSCSDLDNCAGELPPLLHGPRAGLPCWRERECEGNSCKRESVRKLLWINNRQVWWQKDWISSPWQRTGRTWSSSSSQRKRSRCQRRHGTPGCWQAGCLRTRMASTPSISNIQILESRVYLIFLSWFRLKRGERLPQAWIADKCEKMRILLSNVHIRTSFLVNVIWEVFTKIVLQMKQFDLLSKDTWHVERTKL